MGIVISHDIRIPINQQYNGMSIRFFFSLLTSFLPHNFVVSPMLQDDSDLSMLDIYALTWQESDTEATKLQEIFLTLNSNYWASWLTFEVWKK